MTALLALMSAMSLWPLVRHVFAVPTSQQFHAEIEQRRRVESELRVSEERLQAFMRHSPTVALIKDEAGRIVYINARSPGCAGFGLTSTSQLNDKTDYDLWPEVADQLRGMTRRYFGKAPLVSSTNRSR